MRLGGALATIVPADKKIVHGMRDAIMVPTAVDMRTGELGNFVGQSPGEISESLRAKRARFTYAKEATGRRATTG